MNKIETRKMLIEEYKQTQSIRKTARIFGTSRNLVRKWVKWWIVDGEEGLNDISKRPKHSRNQTPEEIENIVIKMRKSTNYGRRRLRDEIKRESKIEISENTIRNILRRHNYGRKNKRRNNFYPAEWYYDNDRSFTVAQVDTKDIYEEKTLGSYLCWHIW